MSSPATGPQPAFFPTRAHVLVCTGPSCSGRGSRGLFATLWRRFERERLAYYAGGSLRLTECGCLGACSFGPNLVCYVDGSEAWYAGMDEEQTMELARSLRDRTPLPEHGRYDDG